MMCNFRLTFLIQKDGHFTHSVAGQITRENKSETISAMLLLMDLYIGRGVGTVGSVGARAPTLFKKPYYKNLIFAIF